MKTILILSSLALALACGKPEAPRAAEAAPVAVRLATGTSAGASRFVAVTLSAARRATLATRIAASVRQVHVTEGQQVAEGALLVSLADEDLQGALKAAQANLDAAATQVRRMENLARQNAAIPAEMDQATVQLAQAQAALAGARTSLGHARIRSPFAGVVQVRRVSEGDFVGPGQPLLELEGRGPLEFTGTVSDAEARVLRIGLTLPFEADGRTGQARITGLATGGDPVSHRAALRATVVGGGEGLRSGTFGRLALPGLAPDAGALSVPRGALVQRGELSGVFVAKGGRAELRWLSLGEPEGDRYPVRAGLGKDDQVIDQPGDLKDGQPIEVRK